MGKDQYLLAPFPNHLKLGHEATLSVEQKAKQGQLIKVWLKSSKAIKVSTPLEDMPSVQPVEPIQTLQLHKVCNLCKCVCRASIVPIKEVHIVCPILEADWRVHFVEPTTVQYQTH